MTDRPCGEVIIYRRDDGAPALEVRLDAETVWLSQQQIADLFETSRENVTMHLRNVFSEGELDPAATSKDFLQVRQEGTRAVRRKVVHYNLDAIISVGYRVKSSVATQFRIWATARLHDYLVKGAAINETRLEQIGSIVRVLSRSGDDLVAGVADVIAGYLPSLRTLRDYDSGVIDMPEGTTPSWVLTYDEARLVIDRVRASFPDDQLFGQERGDELKGIVATIYQEFGGHALYPSLQVKAANLLYLVVKDHPLSDGNKRSAAALFIHFLAMNDALVDTNGVPRINNNTLAALTLMVALSDPQEKDLMIALLGRLLTGDER